MLVQAAASASSYAEYVSPIHRLWKYVVLGLTSIVFEEANPIFGGIAASNRRLGLIGVITAVALGTWIWSIGLYFLGRWRIQWLRTRFPSWQKLLDAAQAQPSIAIALTHPIWEPAWPAFTPLTLAPLSLGRLARWIEHLVPTEQRGPLLELLTTEGAPHPLAERLFEPGQQR